MLRSLLRTGRRGARQLGVRRLSALGSAPSRSPWRPRAARDEPHRCPPLQRRPESELSVPRPARPHGLPDVRSVQGCRAEHPARSSPRPAVRRSAPLGRRRARRLFQTVDSSAHQNTRPACRSTEGLRRRRLGRRPLRRRCAARLAGRASRRQTCPAAFSHPPDSHRTPRYESEAHRPEARVRACLRPPATRSENPAFRTMRLASGRDSITSLRRAIKR